MNRETIKFQPITHQTSTFTYNAAQVISNYLKPLCKNKYIVNGTQSFFQELSTLLHLKNEGYVSYNVESVFAKVSFTTDYIIDQTYVQKRLMSGYMKLRFKRLFRELATECKFTF